MRPADLFVSPDLTEEQARRYLQTFGFRDPAAADEHLQAMADDLPVREAMADLAAPLLDALSRAPDPDAALVGFARYVATRAAKTMFLQYLHDDPQALGVLVDLMGTSPFLGDILIRSPEYFHWLIGQIDRSPPDAHVFAEEADAVLDRIERPDGHLDALKRLKRREILRIAARDILGRETLESATEQLSDLADVITERSLRIAEQVVCGASSLDRLPGRFVVIGMGKLGGRELNYSSDIDLLYVYEPEDEEAEDAHTLFQKLGRTLTTLLTEYTDESYLYRVDLRLRPSGRHGNITYSLRQYGQYYDTWGETFERFALIKARPIAGDRALGRRFLDLVQPFVYRKYLDHAAIEEMARHKKRLERARGDIDRDVKIGRGGIREIELFTQVLQLTYGGAQPELRATNTLTALTALARGGLIADAVRDDLSRAYVFLRTVEHRLQIVQELQTHTLSSATGEIDISARRLGFADGAALEAELKAERGRVHRIYRTLFERRRGTTDFKSRQFFRILAEEVSDREALEHVAGYGLADPAAALDVIRALNKAAAEGPSYAMSRNVLANLLAVLMDRLDRSVRPDHVLMRLEQLTVQTGAAASLFRTLLENEALRELLVSVLDLGDLPAGRLLRYPELLDSLLFALPDLDELKSRYVAALSRLAPEHRRDQIRRFKAIEEFKILAEWVASGSLGTVQRRLSLLADCCVTHAAAWHAPDGEPDWAILALGKLGGRELTVHSDLDLVVIYRGDPHDARTFFERQSFVGAMERFLEEPTGEGVAYHIDSRLRPEGQKGALAVPLAMFERYLGERAEIWERLAWTRYRFLAGSHQVAADVQVAVEKFVYGPWDSRIPRYVTEVRRRMERELGAPAGQLDFKVGRGGLADIDFLLEVVQIREGHTNAAFRVPGTRELLDSFPPTPLLTAPEVEELGRAYAFLRALEMFARLETDTNVTAVSTDPARLTAIGQRLKMEPPAGPMLGETYERQTTGVRTIFSAVPERLRAAGE